MRDQRINAGTSDDGAPVRRCSRCGNQKPADQFYRNPSAICKSCQRRAAQLSHQVRRVAIAQLVSAHRDEYRRLLVVERGKRVRELGDLAGGDQDVA
jgi:recombinational DNA repair protein (RecF pathway)